MRGLLGWLGKGWALALKSTGVNGVNALSMFERIRDIGELNQLIRLYLTHEIRRDHVAADTEFQHIMSWAEYMREQDYGRYETPSERAARAHAAEEAHLGATERYDRSRRNRNSGEH